jgi:DNA-binding MarR family transcriptional regulator
MTDTMTADPLQLDRQVCFALAAAARTVVAVYRPILEPLGLTHPQYLVMLALWEQEPRSAGELAATLYWEPATLTPLIRRLEAAGLVTRERAADDERRLVIGLTDAGRRLRVQAELVPPRVVETLGVPIAELERMRDSLTTVIAAASRAVNRT